jgi:hypothetical protein
LFEVRIIAVPVNDPLLAYGMASHHSGLLSMLFGRGVMAWFGLQETIQNISAYQDSLDAKPASILVLVAVG